ncbi:hypothetical protein SODG_006165 [Sodalis praecaptivus]|nr:hypothetical protein NVIRENTERO_00459 [Sodalis praecaptivus]
MQGRPPLRARQRFPDACIRGGTGKGEGAMAMSENAADKAICHEIGAAVVTALATRRTLTVQTLIDLVEASRHAESGCGPERRRAMAGAVALLTIFV